jgi:hypothetical protein
VTTIITAATIGILMAIVEVLGVTKEYKVLASPEAEFLMGVVEAIFVDEDVVTDLARSFVGQVLKFMTEIYQAGELILCM